MPTYIDESGNTGQVSGGGSPYFRLAAVWVPDELEADEFRWTIRRLRQELGLRREYEFKFSRSHSFERRQAFFKAAASRNFRFAVSSVDKTHPDWVEADGPRLHRACVTDLAATMRPIYASAIEAAIGKPKEPIIVDDNEDHAFLTVLKEQFRSLRSPANPTDSMIGKVRFRSLVPDEMIQLADMVCGAVGLWYDERDATWYDQIANRDVGAMSSP